jgi:hypothetical protein
LEWQNNEVAKPKSQGRKKRVFSNEHVKEDGEN